ncbi:hypothetical protein MP638_000240 [Amoeboaphelidium occidentale]|nr:hypothetical protein MP638_000240 [Amoeboaphelidium occidentale]
MSWKRHVESAAHLLKGSLSKLRTQIKPIKTVPSVVISKEALNNSMLKLVNYVNSVNGYKAIERLKQEVIISESAYERAREALRKAKEGYSHSLQSRSECQREINNLLQRKHTWAPTDVTRFTELYSSEHLLEQKEAQGRADVVKCENEMDEAHRRLMDVMRERYREEQIWSDYVRSFSSYGTFGLMAVNLFVFLAVQGFLEPRRRQNMKNEIVSRVNSLLAPITQEASSYDDKLSQIISSVSLLEERFNAVPERQSETIIQKIPSEPIIIKESDLQTAALYAASGAFVGMIISSLLFRLN